MSGPSNSSLEDRSRHADTLHGKELDRNEEGQSMADDSTYEPGPSFVEGDRPGERLAEMPAWLQSFAAQESTRDEAAAELSDEDAGELPAMAVEDQSESVSPDSILPEWLRDQQSDGQQAQVVADESSNMMDFLSNLGDSESSDKDGFISEDDLPDWLRAFADESSAPTRPAAEVTRLPAARSVPQTGTAAVRVPPVENVWLSAVERQALGSGGTLFALLASNSNGTVTHSQGAGSSEGIQNETRASDPGQREQSKVVRRADAQSGSVDPVPAKQPNSMRLLLITLLVVLAVIAISFLLFT